jgi:hypothetical protein
VSTVGEIESVLPKLTTDELGRVEHAVHQQYRERQADLIASAEKAFLAQDKEEQESLFWTLLT